MTALNTTWPDQCLWPMGRVQGSVDGKLITWLGIKDGGILVELNSAGQEWQASNHGPRRRPSWLEHSRVTDYSMIWEETLLAPASDTGTVTVGFLAKGPSSSLD
jgi:hypothetical protein